MEKTGAYAILTQLPFKTSKPLKTTHSAEVEERLKYLSSMKIGIFTDENTGEIFARITDINTGETKVVKCEETDEN